MPTFETSASDNTQRVGSGGGALAGWNLTIQGTNPVAIVGVAWQSGGTHEVTGVTIGGNAMTSMGAFQDEGDRRIHGWYYVNPPSGAQEVIVTFGTGSLNNRGVCMGGICYSDASQSDPPISGYAGADGLNSEADITITSTEGELVVTLCCGDAGTWTVDDAGANERIDIQNTSVTADCSLLMADRAGASPNVATEHTHSSPASDNPVIGASLAAAASTENMDVTLATQFSVAGHLDHELFVDASDAESGFTAGGEATINEDATEQMEVDLETAFDLVDGETLNIYVAGFSDFDAGSTIGGETTSLDVIGIGADVLSGFDVDDVRVNLTIPIGEAELTTGFNTDNSSIGFYIEADLTTGFRAEGSASGVQNITGSEAMETAADFTDPPSNYVLDFLKQIIRRY